jgi:phosphopantetheinyl transferase (holo-ACP synthase)
MALLGRPVTEKTRNKASASLKAFYTVPENRKKIIEGASKRKRRLFKIARSGEALAEFFSVKEAAKSVGCRPGCLVRAAKANETNPPRLRTAAGFVWRYAEAT